MLPDGVFAQTKPPADDAIRETVEQQLQHVALTAGETQLRRRDRLARDAGARRAAALLVTGPIAPAQPAGPAAAPAGSTGGGRARSAWRGWRDMLLDRTLLQAEQRGDALVGDRRPAARTRWRRADSMGKATACAGDRSSQGQPGSVAPTARLSSATGAGRNPPRRPCHHRPASRQRASARASPAALPAARRRSAPACRHMASEPQPSRSSCRCYRCLPQRSPFPLDGWPVGHHVALHSRIAGQL